MPSLPLSVFTIARNEADRIGEMTGAVRGSDSAALGYRSAFYVGRILKGTRDAPSSE